MPEYLKKKCPSCGKMFIAKILKCPICSIRLEDIPGIDKDGYDREGYNRRGYNKDGYDRDGYDKDGYDRDGYGKKGYNSLGFNKEGYTPLGYNKDGYDREGYNRRGYNKDGYDRGGYNQHGIHKETGTHYNKHGYNRRGYDKDGYDFYGYNNIGYDREGYNRLGYDEDGYDREGYNTIGYNRHGYDRDGYDRYGFNKKHIHRDTKDRFNIEGYNRDGFDKDGFDKSGYSNEGYNRDGFDKDGFDKNGFNQYGLDRWGYDKDGYDKDGYNISDYNKHGYNRDGFDKDGFDKNGFNQYGLDKYGNKKESEIIDFIEGLKKKYPRAGYIYHFTGINNLPSILKDGLLSRNNVNDHLEIDSSSHEIQERAPDWVHNCVRFYLRPQSPMLYRVEGIKITPDKWPHCPIPFYMLFDLQSILEEYKTSDIFFSDRNMASSSARFTDLSSKASINFLKREIKWTEIYDNYVPSQEQVSLRAAECMIKNKVNLSALSCIVFRSGGEMELARYILKRKSIDLNTYNVKIEPKYFFNRWPIIQEFSISKHNVFIKLDNKNFSKQIKIKATVSSKKNELIKNSTLDELSTKGISFNVDNPEELKMKNEENGMNLLEINFS